MRTLTRVTRGQYCLETLAALGLLSIGAACGPTQAAARTSPTPVADVTPAVTPNPAALAPNDCVGAPPSAGTKVHSARLGTTVTLPSGWAENPSMEGKSGLQATLEFETGTDLNRASVSADPFTLTKTAHDAVTWEISQPGSGTFVLRGDCTIARSPAAFFEATIQFTLMQGTFQGDVYAVYIDHRGALIRLLIDLPSSLGPVTPMPPRASVITDVKSIFGSWTWDKP